MSVKIRLSRGGTKKRPYYYIVVADSTSPRDGRYIEQIGTHNPLLAKDNADRVKLDVERCQALARRSARSRPTAWRASSTRPASPSARRSNNPSKAKPKKKRLEREAAQAEAAAKKAEAGEAKPAA